MSTPSSPAVPLDPVPVTTPALVRAAQALALTGRAVQGDPARAAPSFADPTGPVVLLAVGPGRRPVAVAAWEYPGPSRRIPSATLVCVAVDRSLDPEAAAVAARFLLTCVPLQFAQALFQGGGDGGYVVADVPWSRPEGALFLQTGWAQLPPAAGAATVRYAYFPPKGESPADEGPNDGRSDDQD